MFRVILALVFLLPDLAGAGYYARTTVRGSGEVYSQPVGTSSGCYLLPSMAIASLFGGCYSCYAISSLSGNGTFSVIHSQYPANTSYGFSGTFGSCSQSPAAVASMPSFVGGVSDPALVDNTILTGSGTSGAAVSHEDIQALASAVQSVSTQAAAGTSSVSSLNSAVSALAFSREFDPAVAGALFAFFFSSISGIFLISRLAADVLGFIRRR